MFSIICVFKPIWLVPCEGKTRAGMVSGYTEIQLWCGFLYDCKEERLLMAQAQ